MIYIHIPFCKQKCSYCNFHFSTSLKLKEDVLYAIHKEIELRHQELKSKTINTLYFGGGSPSILNIEEIQKIIDKTNAYFDFDDAIEITLEANPDDLSTDFLKGLSKTPINRLSIGTQSFHDEDLKLMNRAHDASEAYRSIAEAQDFGFENISIDLIYGSPSSSFDIWKENLDKALVLSVPHISSYALTVEPKTALEKWMENGKVPFPKEEEQSQEFDYMVKLLTENEFEHYEISNFAKPGFHSRHNSAYWKYHEYLGIGASAHSYDGVGKRSWNIANNSRYSKGVKSGVLAIETEILSETERYNEMMMIGLRTQWGVDIVKLKQTFSNKIMLEFERSIADKLKSGHLVIENQALKIPKPFWFLADGIASDLFIV